MVQVYNSHILFQLAWVLLCVAISVQKVCWRWYLPMWLRQFSLTHNPPVFALYKYWDCRHVLLCLFKCRVSFIKVGRYLGVAWLGHILSVLSNLRETARGLSLCT